MRPPKPLTAITGACYARRRGRESGESGEPHGGDGESVLGEADAFGYRRPLPGFSTNDA